jgi:hypothetical protein
VAAQGLRLHVRLLEDAAAGADKRLRQPVHELERVELRAAGDLQAPDEMSKLISRLQKLASGCAAVSVCAGKSVEGGWLQPYLQAYATYYGPIRSRLQRLHQSHAFNAAPADAARLAVTLQIGPVHIVHAHPLCCLHSQVCAEPLACGSTRLAINLHYIASCNQSSCRQRMMDLLMACTALKNLIICTSHVGTHLPLLVQEGQAVLLLVLREHVRRHPLPVALDVVVLGGLLQPVYRTPAAQEQACMTS